MADKLSAVTEKGRRKSFAKQISSSAAEKAVAPLAAAAATAGTTYLTRKSAEVWRTSVLPRIRENGGGKAIARSTLERLARRVGGRGSEALDAAKRVGVDRLVPQRSSAQELAPELDGRFEERRREREQRRQQRRRALQKSGSS